MKKLIKISLFLLIIFGIFTRIWQFGSVPVSLYWDEVAIGLDAQSIAQTGQDINGQSWLQSFYYSYGDYKAPVYILFVSALTKVLPISETLIRLPSLLASFLSAGFLFLLVKLLSPKKSLLPLLVLTSYMLMPWSIHFSRIGMESHLSLLFLLLSVYLSVLSFKIKKPSLLIISALSVSLGIYTYISLRVIAPLIYLATFSLFKPKKLIQSKKLIVFFVIGLILITASILVLTKSSNYQVSQNYRTSNNNLLTSTSHIDKSVTSQVNPNLFISRLFHHRFIYKAQEYLINYASHFSPQFLIFIGDANLRHHSGFLGQLLIVQAILALIGLFIISKKPLKPTHLLIISLLLLSPTISSLVNEVPHASRSIYLIIPLAWLVGLGLSSLNKKILTLSLFALLINFCLFFHYYFNHYPGISASAWINPYKQAALYIKNNPTDQDIFVTNQFYQPNLYFKFYAQTTIKELSGSCPPNALCITTPDWQPETTKIISPIPNTDQLVVKQSL
jgi:dolichyl-phosphate-mannose-protein mannosyltransferase